MSIQLPEIPIPVDPPSGQWEFFIDVADKQLKLKDSVGAIINLTDLNVNVFGTEFQEIKSDSVGLTTSASFITKLSMVTPPLPAGNYYIGWNYQWSYDDNANDFLGQVTLGGAPSLMEHQQEPKDSGGTGSGGQGTNQQFQISGHDVVPLIAGVHTIEIDYASAGGDTAAIWNARLVMWRTS